MGKRKITLTVIFPGKITDLDEDLIATTITEDDLTKVSRQLDVSMGEMFQLINVFAVVLFALLIYLLTKLIIEKNANAISMVKILGYENREINSLYLTSTTWVVILSIYSACCCLPGRYMEFTDI